MKAVLAIIAGLIIVITAVIFVCICVVSGRYNDIENEIMEDEGNV